MVTSMDHSASEDRGLDGESPDPLISFGWVPTPTVSGSQGTI